MFHESEKLETGFIGEGMRFPPFNTAVVVADVHVQTLLADPTLPAASAALTFTISVEPASFGTVHVKDPSSGRSSAIWIHVLPLSSV